MQLGIIVVYLVSEANEKLLDLHLSQIKKYTIVPYTIYGSANRLLPQLQEKLKQHQEIKICRCPETDLRGRDEHSFYLEHLVRFAIEDGATHIVVLHVDSFPVRSGWATELAAHLSESCVLATIKERDYGRQYTACLFFHREFYLTYHPTFLLSEAEISSTNYKQFYRKFRHILDSGIGYVYKVYAEGLSWYPIAVSSKGQYDNYGIIYGDLIFHLCGAARFENKPLIHTNVFSNFGHVHLFDRAKSIMKPLIPRHLRKYFRIFEHSMGKSIYQEVKQQLLEDPESYLSSLRTGKG
jgi:hypothetical protein